MCKKCVKVKRLPPNSLSGIIAAKEKNPKYCKRINKKHK